MSDHTTLHDVARLRAVLTARLPTDPKWVAWVEGVVEELAAGWVEDPRLTQIRALWNEQAVGWFEFIVDRATTHIAYVYEDRSVYLPEGREVVDLDDFHLAAAADKVHRLIRADEVRAVLDAVSVDATPPQGIDPDALDDLLLDLVSDEEELERVRNTILALVRPVEDSRPFAWEVIQERARQVSVEGYTAEHDAGHTEQLLAAALVYLTRPVEGSARFTWPWSNGANRKDEHGDLVRAAALVLAAQQSLVRPVDGILLSPDRPEVVVLCGSTRFYNAFQRANFDLTMQGKIVLSVGFYAGSPDQMAVEHGEGVGITPEQKVVLDELHKRKIDLADRVLVLNVGGYIGESTRSEVAYAKAHGKPVDWLEPALANRLEGGA